MPPASPMIPPPAPAEQPRRWTRRLLRFAVILTLAVLLLTVSAGLFLRFGTGWLTPEPAPTAPTAQPEAPVSPAPGGAAPASVDGCLGGPVDVDRAVVSAQERAALDEAGAAGFAATVLRWALSTPASASKPETAERVLAPGATEAARSLGEVREQEGTTTAVDFTQGRYYLEAFDGTTAVVSVVARGTGTYEGAPYDPAVLYPTITLVAEDGVWRVQDYGGDRSLDELQGLSAPYTGGC